MSYILEALEEAQKSRDDTRAPNLRSVHVEPKALRPAANKWLAYVSVVVVVLAGGLGINWWIGSPGEQIAPERGVPQATTQKTTRDVPTAEAVDQPVVERVAGQAAVQPDSVASDPVASDPVASDPLTSGPAVTKPALKSPVVTDQVPDRQAGKSDTAVVSVPDSPEKPLTPTLAPVSPPPVTDAEIPEKKAVESASVPLDSEPPAVGGEVVVAAGNPDTSGAAALDSAFPDSSQDNIESRSTNKATRATGPAPPVEKPQSDQVALIEDRPAVEAMATTTDALLADEQTSSAKPLAEPPVPHFRSLPYDIQQSLPTITYSVHLYSAEPAHRMVKIDGRVRREGDTIKPGLVLKEITPTGAIFNFRDNVFHVPVNG